MGIIKPISEATAEVKEYFDGLRDSWKSALTDMSRSSEDWKNELIDQVFSDLVDSTIIDAPLDVMIGNTKKHFDNLQAYLDDWSKRYEAVLKDTTLSDEQRADRLKELMDEQTAVMDEQAKKSKAIAESLGKDVVETFSNALDNLGDKFVEFLTDANANAEDMGKEIAATLMREMLKEMLAQEKYADQIAAIKQLWQNILKSDSGWWWTDTEGQFGPKGAVWTIEKVLGMISDLEDEIAGDTTLQSVADRIKEIEKAAEEAAEKAESAFKDLRGSFIDSLTDMDSSIESFRKKLEEIAIKDLMEKTVLDSPFSAGLNGLVKDFKGIDDYIEQWTELYDAAAKAGETELIDALLDELAAVYELTAEQAEELRERLRQITKDTTFTDMEDSFVSALMDMDGDIEGFAEDMKKTIIQNLVEAFMVSEEIRPMLEELQKTFNFVMGQKGWTNEQRIDFMTNGGTIDGVEYKGIDGYEDDMNTWKDTVDGLLAYAGIVKKETDELLGSITSNITSMLTDSESTAKDFAASMKESIVNSLIEAYTASEDFQQGLADVKKQMQEAIESGDPTKIQEAEKAAEEFWNNATEGVKAYTDALEKAQQEQDSTFKDMTSELMSSLTDIDNTAEDWANELGRKIAEKIFEGMIKESALLENIQKAFNDAVAAATTTDEEGISHIDWKAIANNPALKQAVEESKSDFNELQANWEAICASLGIELERAAKEGFSDLRGAFVSALLDMDGDAETFGKQIGRTMLEQMLNAYVDNKWKDEIKALNQEWAEALESGNTAAIERIKQKVKELYEAIGNDTEVIDIADAIKELDKQLDTTFSDMADSWASALMDMEGTAEDWAQTVGKMIAEKIIKAMVIPTMIQPILNTMQKAWNEAAEQEGATYQTMLDAMTPYLSDLVGAYEELRPIADYILNSLGVYKETVEEVAEEVEYALQDMKDNFVSDLMDMESTAEKRAQSISRTIAENLIKNFVLGEAFDQQMEAWQQQYQSIITSGMSEDERRRQVKQLRDAIAYAKEGYVEEARAIQELLGLNNASDQGATANIADKITYEQGDELVGINMAQEMTLEQILATLKGGNLVPTYTPAPSYGQDMSQQVLATLQGMQAATSVTGNSSDIFNRLGYTNEYLRAIRDSNQQMLETTHNLLSAINGKLARL